MDAITTAIVAVSGLITFVVIFFAKRESKSVEEHIAKVNRDMEQSNEQLRETFRRLNEARQAMGTRQRPVWNVADGCTDYIKEPKPQEPEPIAEQEQTRRIIFDKTEPKEA